MFGGSKKETAKMVDNDISTLRVNKIMHITD